MAQLRIEVFREFPYLYEGNLSYEKKYLERYIHSSNSLVVLVESQNQIIGASTCLPLKDEDPEFKKPFSDRDISKIFYFGESIILKEFRGQKLGHKFFELREEHAKNTIKDLELATFCSVDRAKHPLTPENYKPLNAFWKRLGYLKLEGVTTTYSWKDVGQALETPKMMHFFGKSFELSK